MPFQPVSKCEGEGREKEREKKYVSKNLGDRRRRGEGESLLEILLQNETWRKRRERRRGREFVRDSFAKWNMEEGEERGILLLKRSIEEIWSNVVEARSTVQSSRSTVEGRGWP